MKRLAILDMDGTLLDAQTVKVLCKEFGLKAELESIDRQANSLNAYKISEAIALLFLGLKAKDMEKVFDSIPIVNGAKAFVDFLKSNNFITAIVTDSYVFLASRLAKRLNIDIVKGNELEICNGTITGRITMPLGWEKQKDCLKKAICKLRVMRELAKENSVDINGILAVGDTKNDLCMVEKAKIGVAFRPKDPEITKVADITVQTDFFELIRKLKEFQPEWWIHDYSGQEINS